jgi:hypothetical protein
VPGSFIAARAPSLSACPPAALFNHCGDCAVCTPMPDTARFLVMSRALLR